MKNNYNKKCTGTSFLNCRSAKAKNFSTVCTLCVADTKVLKKAMLAPMNRRDLSSLKLDFKDKILSLLESSKSLGIVTRKLAFSECNIQKKRMLVLQFGNGKLEEKAKIDSPILLLDVSFENDSGYAVDLDIPMDNWDPVDIDFCEEIFEKNVLSELKSRPRFPKKLRYMTLKLSMNVLKLFIENSDGLAFALYHENDKKSGFPFFPGV